MSEHMESQLSPRRVVVYGTLPDGRSARTVAKQRAREIANMMGLRKLPTLIYDEVGTRGLDRPIVHVVGALDDRMWQALAVCRATHPDGEKISGRPD